MTYIVCYVALYVWNLRYERLLYGSALAPVTVYLTFNFLYLMYPVFFRELYPYVIEEKYYHLFMQSHLLGLLIFILAYRYLAPFKVLRFVPPKRSLLRWGFVVFIVLYMVFFLVLMIKSQVGSMWLLNPREAYQFHRAGVGVFYTISTMFFCLAYLLSLFIFKNKLILLVFFLGMSQFFGSKMVLIFIVLAYMIYYIHGKRRKLFTMVNVVLMTLLIGVVGVGLAKSLNETSAIFAIFKYSDYVMNSIYFFQEFNKNSEDYLFGEVFVSSFWQFVPRSLVDDKPYAYGDILITEYLWPNLAEATHTPGKLEYMGYFYDFGYVGWFLFFVIKGWLFKSLGWAFRKNRFNVLYLMVFLFLMNFPVVRYVGTLGMLVFLVVSVILIRVGNKYVAR